MYHKRMNIVIVDDSKRDYEEISGYLKKFEDKNQLEINVTIYESADKFFDAVDLNKINYDMIVMDIDMPGTNGIDAAKKIREHDEKVVLMFVTNMPQYAMIGYEVEAIDYVLKPVEYETFELKMTKALRYIRRNRPEKLRLETAEGSLAVSINDIYYIESILHYLYFHTKTDVIKVRMTMSDIEKLLGGYSFSRCNSGYLVNLAYVDSINKDEVSVAGDVLKISRGRKNDFTSSFTKYLGGFS